MRNRGRVVLEPSVEGDRVACTCRRHVVVLKSWRNGMAKGGLVKQQETVRSKMMRWRQST
jgi:hypothetical protein